MVSDSPIAPGSHPAQVISAWIYYAVCAALILFTLLTVGVSFVPLEGNGHIALGMAIAAIKAFLVVVFFMHAIESPRVTWAVVAVAVFWMLILLTLTFSDYLTRHLVPFAPGH